MKKGLIACLGIGIGVLVIVLIIAAVLVGTYNSLVKSREEVDSGWAQVENQYQRRADLIPNLIETVKGFASQEEEVLTEVTRLRSQWSEARDSGNIDQQIAAAQGLDNGISRLLLVAEDYPELKSNENFLKLQDQLEGTENRIAVERGRYNESVRDFNKKIKTFPNSLLAGIFGFESYEYFEAEEGTDQPPVVDFE